MNFTWWVLSVYYMYMLFGHARIIVCVYLNILLSNLTNSMKAHCLFWFIEKKTNWYRKLSYWPVCSIHDLLRTLHEQLHSTRDALSFITPRIIADIFTSTFFYIYRMLLVSFQVTSCCWFSSLVGNLNTEFNWEFLFMRR